jgi:2-methylcitrate dehydratase PrpD
MTTRTLGVSAQLAAFLTNAVWDDLPAAVVHEAKRSLVNYFGCALGGCRDPVIEAAASALRPYAGRPVATVIGRGERTDALNGAFLNAAAANVFDFDDTHERTIIHPTAPVAAAVFALAEDLPLTGRQLLRAFIIGIEAECRIGNAVSPHHYRRGWHITSTCGVFGAAAAVGSAIGLAAERMNWALGNASAQSGGLLETLGSMAKSVSVGNAARNGFAAAVFANAGIAGPDRPLEGPYGFLPVTSGEFDVACLTDGLGEQWEIARNTYKPYPSGIVLNPVIEACLELSSERSFHAADIDRIEVTGQPLLRERTDRVHPASGREAQVSAQHAVAVALTRGRAGLAEFTDACAKDASLAAMREKVVIIDDARYAVDSAAVTVHLRGEEQRSRKIDHARGSATRPLADGALEQKLRELLEYGRSRCDANAIIDALWSLDTAHDAGAVMALARG